jgi:hypothetical protein
MLPTPRPRRRIGSASPRINRCCSGVSRTWPIVAREEDAGADPMSGTGANGGSSTTISTS